MVDTALDAQTAVAPPLPQQRRQRQPQHQQRRVGEIEKEDEVQNKESIKPAFPFHKFVIEKQF